ncbi:glycosyltransferase family 2 protein [Caenimonas koreensis]|uniref:glycosyltransferase family 2 protein n=1 Tax=Caenimonas koreensis TaxID=367474 RepID=UPI0037834438
MTSIAFITTCKSRLMHVQQTLPMMVAQAPDEIIFVDYGCPQQSGAWVQAHCPGVKVVRMDDDPGFCAARARNAGAAASTSDWLCFIDADVRTAPGWLAWLRDHLRTDAYWRAARLPDGTRDRETWGTFLCTRASFEQLGGFDEVFRGWGGEDADLYQRLGASGLHEQNYPLAFVSAISHGDHLRVLHHDNKDMRLQWAIINAYRDIKAYASDPASKAQMLPQETRQSIMDQVTSRVRQLGANPQVPLPAFKVNVSRDKLIGAGLRLRTTASLVFEIALDPKKRQDD